MEGLRCRCERFQEAKILGSGRGRQKWDLDWFYSGGTGEFIHGPWAKLFRIAR